MSEEVIVWTVLIATGAGILLVVVPTLMFGAPPTPSSRLVRRCVAQALAEQDIPEGVIYDLGSGWGGMAHYLAVRFPERQVIGIERSLLPWLVSVLIQKLAGRKNLHFRLADFRTVSMVEAGAIVCYLGPDLSEPVVAAIGETGGRTCIVVSCFFALPGLTQLDQRTARDLYRTPVYIYRV